MTHSCGLLFPCSRCSRCESTRKGFAGVFFASRCWRCWPGRRRAGQGRVPASWRWWPVPSASSLRGADRGGRCAGCVSLAAAASRGRQARPWARRDEKGTQIVSTPGGELVAGPALGWSRACPPGNVVPAALAVVPVAVPEGGERLRTMTHSCGLLFPCSRCSRCKSTRKGFAWCSSRRGAGAAGRAGAGLVEVEGLPSWCRGRWPDSPCRLHGRPVPALPASAGVRKVTAPALRCARNCRVPLPTIIQSYR
jgi:hypothetical protein